VSHPRSRAETFLASHHDFVPTALSRGTNVVQGMRLWLRSIGRSTRKRGVRRQILGRRWKIRGWLILSLDGTALPEWASALALAEASKMLTNHPFIGTQLLRMHDVGPKRLDQNGVCRARLLSAVENKTIAPASRTAHAALVSLATARIIATRGGKIDHRNSPSDASRSYEL
jgi:hypothetical protein